MSDFPRGWTLVQETAGGALNLVVPAVAGVVHVLDAFVVILNNTAAGFVALNLTLNSSDGIFTNFVLGLPIAQGASSGIDSDSGLDLAAGPGASLTIATGAAVTGNQYLRIKGHDI